MRIFEDSLQYIAKIGICVHISALNSLHIRVSQFNVMSLDDFDYFALSSYLPFLSSVMQNSLQGVSALFSRGDLFVL